MSAPPKQRPSRSPPEARGSSRRESCLVAIAGLIRQSVLAHYLGDSGAADAFKAGFRIPNILQNLLGEGCCRHRSFRSTAACSPRAKRRWPICSHGASARFSRLIASVLVLVGTLATPYLIDFIAPGFGAERRELTITVVRILFPCTGLLVMSAWCLGVLNSHRKFFVSYAAGVAFNVAMIATLLIYGPRRSQDALAIYLAWGRGHRRGASNSRRNCRRRWRCCRNCGSISARWRSSLRAVFNNLLPVVVSRGVVQFSRYIDQICSRALLPIGAVAALNYGQIFYMLPISLFGFSVAAAELPTRCRARRRLPTMSRPRCGAGSTRDCGRSRFSWSSLGRRIFRDWRCDRRVRLSIRPLYP